MNALLSTCQQEFPGFDWESASPYHATGTSACFCLEVSSVQSSRWEGRLYHQTDAATRRLLKTEADALSGLGSNVRECLQDLSAAALRACTRHPVPKRVQRPQRAWLNTRAGASVEGGGVRLSVAPYIDGLFNEDVVWRWEVASWDGREQDYHVDQHGFESTMDGAKLAAEKAAGDTP